MTREEIAAVMRSIPGLNDFGIGLSLNGYQKSREERAQELRDGEEALLNSGDRCEVVCQWLKGKRPKKTCTENSYVLKHMLEKEAGEYVTNGVFIAAAVHCGFPYKVRPGSPNVFFGISKKDL